MRNALPMAKRDTETKPDQSLAQLLVRRVSEEGVDISEGEARTFILSVASQDADTMDSDNSDELEVARSIPKQRTSSSMRPKSQGAGTKAPTPSAIQWRSKVAELRTFEHLNTWKDICDHLRIEVGGDSARRRLQKWVMNNRPRWPNVPSV